MESIRVALIQAPVVTNLIENLKNAAEQITEAKQQGAKLVVLPECFTAPYGREFYKKYCEFISWGPTCKMLSKAAKDNSIFLIGGTFVEADGYAKYYNTCTVWNPEGQLVAKYRKMHLSDMDIPGQITFKESDFLSPGNELAVFEIEGIKIGIGIGHDLRFEEHAKLYGLMGCKMLIYPDQGIHQEAFNYLNEEAIKDLIPKIGDRVKFSNHYRTHQATQQAASQLALLDISNLSEILAKNQKKRKEKVTV